MNFFDSYGVAGPSTTTENQTQNANQPSLDEEVQEVIGNFRSFWGGFKKQSANVLQSARKELTDVAGQAQRELTRLTADPASGTIPSTQTATGSTTVAAEPSESRDLDPITGTTAQEEETTLDVTPSQSEDGSSTPLASTSASSSSTAAPATSPGGLFSSFQSAIPANWLETARGQLPESLRQVDSTQLRSTLLTEFQRIQDVTLAHAEEYAHKGEALLEQAVENASHALKDVVKIIPPEEQVAGGSQMPPVLSWDGGDMWALPIGPLDAGASRSGDGATSKGKTAAEGQSAVISRAELLLLRLKQDPDIIRRDPADDGELGKSYAKWAAEDFEDSDGIEGEEYGEKIKVLMEDEAMKNTRDTLVPSEMEEEEFWRRYFFRAHQIQVESEKRKAIIEGTMEEEEVSWEDDDDESSTHESATPEVLDRRKSNATLKAPAVVRDSSDDGFDVVSAGTISPGEPRTKAGSRDEESSDESDWE